MKTNLVSVVVPIWNAEAFLPQCIDSILEQSYSNLEVILIDDCSTDESLKICERYVNMDKRIKLIKNVETGGASKARNCGIVNATGNFVCFIDADDFIERQYIETLEKRISEECVPVVFAGYKYFQKGYMIPRKCRIQENRYKAEDIYSIVIDDGSLSGILFGSACGAIYSLPFIKEHKIMFNETLKRNEDGFFNIELLAINSEFYTLNYDGYIYRQWKENEKLAPFDTDKELDVTTKAIINQYCFLEDFDLQIKRRSVSVIFWNAIRIGRCKGTFQHNAKKLKKYIQDSPLRENYKYLKFEKIGIYKKILIWMLYKNWVVGFYLAMKYIYPLLSKFR